MLALFGVACSVAVETPTISATGSAEQPTVSVDHDDHEPEQTVVGAAEPTPESTLDPSEDQESETENRCSAPRGAAGNQPRPTSPSPESVVGASQSFGDFFGPGLLTVTAVDDQLARELLHLDDGRLVSVTYDNNFFVWDPARPDEPPQFSEPTQHPLLEVGAGPGTLVITSDQEGGVHIFDADAPGTSLHEFDWYRDSSMSLTRLCDGRFVAVDDSNVITVWDPVTEQSTILRSPDDHIRDVHELADGRLITASTLGKVRIWDMQSDDPTPRAFDSSFDNWSVVITELDDGLFAVSDGTDRVQIFDPDGSAAPVARRGPLGDEETTVDETLWYRVEALPGGRIVIGTAGGGAEVWDPRSNTTVILEPGLAPEEMNLEFHQLYPEYEHYFPEAIVQLVVTPDGEVISESSNGILRIWDVGSNPETLTGVASIEPIVVSTTTPGITGSGRIELVGERTLASLGAGAIQTIDIDQLIDAAAEPEARFTAATLDGEIAGTGHRDGSVRLTFANGSTNELVITEDPIVALAVSPTNVAAASADGDDFALHLASYGETGADATTIDVPAAVSLLDYRETTDEFLVGLTNGDVHRLGTNGSLRTLITTDDTAVTDIVELPDGRIAVATDASTVWIADPTSGDVAEIAHPFGAPGPMTVVGETLLTSGGEGRFRAWSLDDFAADPTVIDTTVALAQEVTSVPGREDAFMVTDVFGATMIFDLSGAQLAETFVGAFVVQHTTEAGRIMMASPTGAIVLDASSMLGDGPADDQTEAEADQPVKDVQPEVAPLATPELVWESEPVSSPGLVTIDDPPFLLFAHELNDRTLIGIGGDEERGIGIWSWPQGDLDTPEVAYLERETSSVFSSIIVDDAWLVLSVLGPFDPEDADAPDPVGRLEYWDLANLSDGAQRIEDDQYVLDLVALEDGRFAFGDLRPPTRDFIIRNVYDPDERVVLSEQSAPTEVIALADGRIASDGISIWDPSEPERRPENLGLSATGRQLQALPEGGVMWGLSNSWGIDLLDGSGTETYAVPNADHFVVPHLLADGRIAVNGHAGIELYDLADPTAVVASYPLPAGKAGPVYYSDLTYTETHAIGGGRGNSLWVWDLRNPDADGISYDGGVPLLALRDGRILSRTDTGVVLWDPATITGGAAAALGQLCDSASPMPGVLWIGSEGGTVVSWDWQTNPDESAQTVFTHDDEITEMLLVGSLIVTGSHDGTIRLTDATSRAQVGSVDHPGGRVSALAALADGRIAAAGSDGTIIAFDPARPADIVVVGGKGTAEFNLGGTTLLSLGGLLDGRISAGFVENKVRIFDAVENGDQVSSSFPNLPSSQLVTSDGLILVPASFGIAVYDPTNFTAAATMSIPVESYAVPIELDDGRIVTIDDDGTVWVNARQPGQIGGFKNAGSVPGASSDCLSALGYGLVAYTDGLVVRIIQF